VPVSALTVEGTTLEAGIDAGGLEASYAFWVGHEVCGGAVTGSPPVCYTALVGPWGEGQIAAGQSEEAVSVVITGLEANHVYTYWTSVTSSGGSAMVKDGSFRTLSAELEPPPVVPPVPSNPPAAFESPAPLWIGEGVSRSSESAIALAQRAERERAERQWLESPEYKEQLEREEVMAKEEQLQAQELARQKAAKATATACHVPSLKGDSLAQARAALRKRRCELGKVTRPHGEYRQHLVVISQSHPRATKLPAGARIAVVLGQRAR
jgi:hypothetical protein